MRNMKRRRSFYEGNDAPEAETSALKSRYSRNAREIARYAILIQGSGRPVKKKELCEALKSTSKEVTQDLGRADDFLKEQFGLSLVPLKSVMASSNDASAAKDEYVLVSKAGKNRTLLAKSYPEQYRKDYGFMLFVTILIVLKDDCVTLEEIYESYTQGHLHVDHISEGASDVPEDIDRQERARIFASLEAALGRLEAMRAFRVTTETDTVTQEKKKRYHVGPYAQSIIEARILLMLIMRLHFPQDKNILHTPEGQEKYKAVRDILNERIANANFRQTLS